MIIAIKFDMTEEEKEILRKQIIEKAKELDPKSITRENLRKHPEMLATEDHVYRLFGGVSKLKEALKLGHHYKSDKEIIEAVKKVSLKLNTENITRDSYLKNKDAQDPAANSQYNFIEKN